MLDDYPLRRVLGQMDKEKVIKKVAIGHGHPFGSTRRQSQNLVKHSMVSLEELTEHRLESQEAVLARLNQGLEGYHRVWENSPRPGHAEDAFQNHRLRPVHLPHWPQNLVGLDIADWMKRQARSVPPMAPHEELRIKYQTGWIVSVTKKPVATEMLREAFRTVMMTGDREPAGLYDIEDLLWFRSVVRACPSRLKNCSVLLWSQEMAAFSERKPGHQWRDRGSTGILAGAQHGAKGFGAFSGKRGCVL
ncbi:hypothetical protein N5K55_04205 (plasmid) [Pseudomonas aeruginosa]|nr:hypothetical protein [Pseudomonas aeruginosa]